MKLFEIKIWTPFEDTTTVIQAHYESRKDAEKAAKETYESAVKFFESLALDNCPKDKIEARLDWYYDNCGWYVKKLLEDV